MYAYDDMLKAQKRVAAMQKKQLHMPDKDKVYEKNVQHIGQIFGEFDVIENDINLTKRDLDEYMSYHGNAIKNIPTMHNISPLSRKILAQMKKVNFKDVHEDEIRELKSKSLNVVSTWNHLRRSHTALNQMGAGNQPRPKDDPFRRIYNIARDDLMMMINYIGDKLGDIAGHNYFTGSGMEKRFL